MSPAGTAQPRHSGFSVSAYMWRGRRRNVVVLRVIGNPMPWPFELPSAILLESTRQLQPRLPSQVSTKAQYDEQAKVSPRASICVHWTWSLPGNVSIITSGYNRHNGRKSERPAWRRGVSALSLQTSAAGLAKRSMRRLLQFELHADLGGHVDPGYLSSRKGW